MTLTRRRGGAEEDAEKTAEKVKGRESAEQSLAGHTAVRTSLPPRTPLSPCSQVLTFPLLFSASSSAPPRLRVKMTLSNAVKRPHVATLGE
jgi:hypothetical protein